MHYISVYVIQKETALVYKYAHSFKSPVIHTSISRNEVHVFDHVSFRSTAIQLEVILES